MIEPSDPEHFVATFHESRKQGFPLGRQALRNEIIKRMGSLSSGDPVRKDLLDCLARIGGAPKEITVEILLLRLQKGDSLSETEKAMLYLYAESESLRLSLPPGIQNDFKDCVHRGEISRLRART